MRVQQSEGIHDNDNSVPAFGPVLVVGCHGGAGATTIARLLADDAVEWWDPFAVQLPPLAPTIFVTHGNMNGAAKASQLLGSLPDLDERPAILTVVDDGRGPQPYQARLRFHAIGGMLPVFYFPHVMRWRYVDDPLTLEVPAAVGRAVRRLRRKVLSQAVTTKG